MFSLPTFRLYSAPMNAQVRYLMADAESHIRKLQAEMKSKSDDDREIQKQVMYNVDLFTNMLLDRPQMLV